jgi:hypothetical protein
MDTSSQEEVPVQDPWYTPDQVGYHSYRAEIVAWGQETRRDALRAWMQDDAASNWGHRNLILNCSIQDAGPAIHNGGSWGHYYTVDMGNR